MLLVHLSSHIATSVVVLNPILLGVSSELVLYLYLLLVFNILLVTVAVSSSFSILLSCCSQHHQFFHLDNSLSFIEPPIGLPPVAVT
jgi:hypothetical protein